MAGWWPWRWLDHGGPSGLETKPRGFVSRHCVWGVEAAGGLSSRAQAAEKSHALPKDPPTPIRSHRVRCFMTHLSCAELDCH